MHLLTFFNMPDVEYVNLPFKYSSDENDSLNSFLNTLITPPTT